MYFFCGLSSACYGAYYKTCTICSVAAYKDIVWILWVGWFEESHCQQYKVGFDDFFLSVQFHDWTASIRILLPNNSLNFYSLHIAIVVSDKTVCIQQPSTVTAFFV